MDKNNRVLGRKGARELTLDEIDHVTGGVHTTTKCSIDAVTRKPDGDVGEC